MELQYLLKKTKAICHAYIKARDRNGYYATCISSKNTFPAEIMHAGHFYKSELYSSVRFNENNIHLQCEHCNCFKDGNLVAYKPNLINKIGIEAYTELQDSVSLYKRVGFKWDKIELQEIINQYKEKTNQL